jgi:hypothetical protein
MNLVLPQTCVVACVLFDVQLTLASWLVDGPVNPKSRNDGLVGGGRSSSRGLTVS